MKKNINLLVFAALLITPWLANAQGDCTGYTSIPYSTGFEGLSTGSQPACWTAITQGVNGSTTFPCAYNYSSNTHSGSVYYEFESSSSSSNVEIAALPLMQNISSLKLTMWVSANSSYPCSLEVGVMEDNVFVPVDTLNLITFTGGAWASNYHEYTVYFANYTGNGERMAIRATRTGSGQFTLFIDDLSVSEDNGCYPLSNLHSTAITSSSISLAWTDEMNTGITYTVSYWTSTGDTTDITGVTDTTYTVTDLDGTTTYYFKVTPNCSNGDGLPVIGNFTTDCANGSCDITVQMADSYGDGWNGNSRINFYQSGNLAGYAKLTSGSTGTATIHVCSGTPVTFSWQTGSYDYEDSYIIYDGGNSEVYNSATSGVDHSGTIDDPCPTCLGPNALTLDNADQTSLTFHWTPRSGATLFAVYLDGVLVDGNVTDTFYTFTNLNASSAYALGVQSICTSDDSSSVITLTARTACGDIVLPFSDNFDSYPNGEWPACWHRLRAYGTDPRVNAQYHHSGSQAMFLLASNDTTLFCTPSAIPTTGDNIYVRYQAFLTWYSYYTENKWIKAGVMTDTSDMSTFIALDSVGYHNFYDVFEEHEFNTSSLDPTATYWVAWMFYSTNNGYNTNRGAIDDVYIDEIPSCIRPTGTTVTNVTGHTAILSWDDMGTGSYNVYYSTVNNINDANVSMVSTTDTTITLTGLSSETQYYAWVASDCYGSESEANAFNSFTTLVSCPAVTGLAIDTAYSDGAIIVWTAGGNETEWAVALDSNDIEIINDTFYVASGLEAMTGHTLYVRAVCDDDDTSAIASINFATTCENATCNFTVNMTDSYGDGWNGSSIDFYQAGINQGSATLLDGSSGTATIEVCSSAPVEIHFHQGQWASEIGGTVADGSGATVFTISNMDSYADNALLSTVQTPCPDCIMPLHVALDSTSLTATSATIYWEAGTSSAWIVRIDSTYANVTDTFYTFTNLNARTNYTVYVASDCSGDTSMYNSITFQTDCATGSCDITVTSTNDGGYVSSYYSPTLNVFQNDAQVTSVCAETKTVNVCAGIPVVVVYQSPQYSYSYYPPSAIVSDGVGTEFFNGYTSSYSSGDTIATIDNPCPTCLPVSGLRVSHVDSTSITYEWDVINGNTYLVSFDDSAFVVNTTGSYTATGLTANTQYSFRVKAVCDIDDTSSVRTLTRKTTCVMMNLPYVETFENGTVGEMADCWNTVISSNVGSDLYPAVTTDGHNSMNSLTFVANGNCMAATSAIPNSGWMGDQYHISFYARLSSYSTASAGVMTNPDYDSTYTSLVNIINDDEWHFYNIYTTGLNAYETYYFAVNYNGTSTYDALTIDSLVIDIDQGCHYASSLTVTTTTNSATVHWNNDGVTANFVVAYRPSSATTYTYASAGTADSLVINNLQSATSYIFRVGNICSNGDTLWAEINGITECGIIYLPHFENFDAYAQDVLPPCWIYNSTAITHFDGGLFFRNNTGPGYPAVLPQFDQPLDKTEIEFKTKVGPVSEPDAILVGVADANGTFIEWLDTLTNDNQSRSAYVWMTYRYDNYAGTGTRVALGRLYTGSDWALIDDLTVRQIPTCTPAENVVGHNLYDPDSSYFTWSNPDNLTSFQVYVDTVTADTTTIPVNTLTSITAYSYLIPTGILTGGGKYKFFIRTDCTNGYSPWTVVTFGSGEFIMSLSGTDTVTSCGLVIYDNGGPIAGYYSQTSSSLVMYPAGTSNRLQIYGAYLSLYNDGNSTLTIYDGVGNGGTVLYQTSYSGPTTMYDSIVTLPIATSSTGPLTVSFNAGTYVNPGYELYVRCIPIVPCDDPTYIQLNNVTANQASLSWYGNADNYNIYYRQYGSTSWTMTSSTTESITLTGLTTATTYEVQIRAICSALDSSNLSSTFTFTTECNVFDITPGQSLVEDFEGIQVPSTCWQLVYGTSANATDNPVIFDATAAYSGAKGLRFSSANTTASGNYNQTLITPEFNSDSALSVIFYVRASEGTETFRVGYSTSGSEAANFNWQPTVTATTTWMHYRLDIPSTAKYAAINYFSSTPSHHLYVDSLVVTINDGTVDCEEPTITSISATTGTITVNYTSLVSVQAGIVEGDTWDDATTAQDIPDGTSYTFDHLFSDNSQLQDTTTYTVGLRSKCGNDFSEWVTMTISTREIICNDPTDLTATVLSGSSATVSWNGNGSSAWEVNYSDGTNGNTITSSTTSVTITGLTRGTTYTIRVRAICGQHFSEWSNSVTITPSDCLVPMGLSTRDITTNSATIRWSEGEESEWEVAYGPTGSFNITYATHVTLNTNEYTITGLSAGQSYTWVVRTICGENETSDWSAQINFTTTANPQGIDNSQLSTPNSQLSIYPNPASDIVNLTISGVEGEVAITIVDMNGRTVKSMTAFCGQGDCDTTMQVDDLPQGAYFVRATGSNNLNIVKKFVVK